VGRRRPAALVGLGVEPVLSDVSARDAADHLKGYASPWGLQER
jgi:hypothetical protein